MHYRARAFRPGSGRFLQHDPLGYIDSMSAYEYVASRPTNATDPLGEALRVHKKCHPKVKKAINDLAKMAGVKVTWKDSSDSEVPHFEKDPEAPEGYNFKLRKILLSLNDKPDITIVPRSLLGRGYGHVMPGREPHTRQPKIH